MGCVYNRCGATPLQPRAAPFYRVRAREQRQVAKGIRRLGLPTLRACNVAERLVGIAAEIERGPSGGEDVAHE